jgi:putative ABC transport system ATP-binding protein
MPIIKIQDAHKTYQTGDSSVHAVRGVSLSIESGEFIAITGASGSGKSTFMHILGCLDRMDRGTYEFEERRVEKLSKKHLAALRNRRIGFVFQAFNLLPRTSVLYNVALSLSYQGVPRRERHRRASEMLERVGLGDRLHHLSNQLSGGQQQRVAIARALVTRPAVVLADEPTGNLDSKTSIEIMRFFEALNVEDGVTIALVTHEPDIAAYTQRELVFSDGQIICDAPPSQVHSPSAPVVKTPEGHNLALETH